MIIELNTHSQDGIREPSMTIVWDRNLLGPHTNPIGVGELTTSGSSTIVRRPDKVGF